MDKYAAEFFRVIESYQKELGLPTGDPDPTEFDPILKMTVSDIQSIGPDQAAEHAFVLAKLAMHIQLSCNRCQAFLKWANANRSRIQGSGASQELKGMESRAAVKLDLLAWMSRRVEYVADMMIAVQRTRKVAEK